jgi:hypothetical protein
MFLLKRLVDPRASRVPVEADDRDRWRSVKEILSSVINGARAELGMQIGSRDVIPRDELSHHARRDTRETYRVRRRSSFGFGTRVARIPRHVGAARAYANSTQQPAATAISDVHEERGEEGGGYGGRAAKLSERREKGRGAAPSVRISADRETGFPLRDQPLGCCTAECNSTSPAGCRAFCRGLYALLRNIVPAICPLNVPRDRGFAPGATGLALSFPFTARQGGGGGGGGAAGGWFHGSARAETRNRRVARENAPPPFRLVVARTLACERSRRAARRLGV